MRVARDRDHRTFDAVTGFGQVSGSQFARHLLPVFDCHVLLCTYGYH